MPFIATDQGDLVNHAAVKAFRAIEDGQYGQERYAVIGMNDESLGTVSARSLRELLTPITPAVGLFATVITPITDDTPLVERFPIIGWRIADIWPQAILPEEAQHDAMVLIECPDGRLCHQEDVSFTTVEDAIEEVATRQRAEVERLKKKQAA